MSFPTLDKLDRVLQVDLHVLVALYLALVNTLSKGVDLVKAHLNGFWLDLVNCEMDEKAICLTVSTPRL